LNNKNYTMSQLVAELKRFGVWDATKRKVRYLVEKELLPGPTGERGGARYDEDHLYRIIAIQKLWKRLRIPEIKRELDRKTADQIRELALQVETETTAMTIEEADEILSKGMIFPSNPRTPEYKISNPEMIRIMGYTSPHEDSNESTTTTENSWQRFTLLDGVELSVRTDAVRHLERSYPEVVIGIRSIFKRLSLPGESTLTSQKISGAPEAITQRFECYRVKGHLFAEIGQHRALVDTGFPLSFGNCGRLSICGREFAIPRKLAFHTEVYTAEEFGKLIDTDFDVFLGANVLKELDFIIDLSMNNISFAPRIEDFIDDPIALEFRRDLPVVNVHLDGRSLPFLISTGNKLSILHSSLSKSYQIVGKDTDYLPRLPGIREFEGGKFETELRGVKFHLGRKVYALRFGKYPKQAEDFLVDGLGVMGIIGADLLEDGPVGFSMRRELLFSCTPTNESSQSKEVGKLSTISGSEG